MGDEPEPACTCPWSLCQLHGQPMRTVAPDAPDAEPTHPLRAQDVEPLIGKEIG